MDDAIKQLCRHTVLIAPWLRQNENGEAVYGDQVPHKAAISGKNRMLRDATGQLVEATLKVVLTEVVPVSPKDQLILPDSYVPRMPPILSVSQLNDDRGPSHTAIYLQ